MNIVILLVFVAIPALASGQQPLAQRPSWSIGDTWTYVETNYPTVLYQRTTQRTFTWSVLALRKAFYVLERADVGEAAPNHSSKQRWSSDVNHLSRIAGTREWQEYRVYRWPLSEGDMWDVPLHYTDEDTLWHARVGGWESVTVPAGTFRAIRIELKRSGVWNVPGGGAGTKSEVYWYAPEIKRHVRLEAYTYVKAFTGTHRVEELSAYHVQ